MTQEDIQKLNDLRQRILRADELIRAGEPVPDGLEPSDDELREALEIIRAKRIEDLNASKQTKAAAALPEDLAKLLGDA